MFLGYTFSYTVIITRTNRFILGDLPDGNHFEIITHRFRAGDVFEYRKRRDEFHREHYRVY